MKKFLVSLVPLLAILCMNTSYAYAEYSNRYDDRSDRYQPKGRYADIPDPARELKRAVDDLEKFIKGKDVAHPGVLRAYLEKEIFPHFDFDAMAEWITGPYARYMDKEDRVKFKAKLQETYLTALVKHMGGFDPSSTSLRYNKTIFRKGGDEAVVKVGVVRPDQQPARLEFGMRRTDGKWKIVDVKANGTSAILYYRRHFIAELRGYSDRDYDRGRDYDYRR